MDSLNTQQNSPSIQEIEGVISYFEKLGYKRIPQTTEKIIQLAKDYPDKDLSECAKEMYEWFSEANKRGRIIKSYHLTFRNWVKKDYAPKRKKSTTDFFSKEDII